MKFIIAIVFLTLLTACTITIDEKETVITENISVQSEVTTSSFSESKTETLETSEIPVTQEVTNLETAQMVTEAEIIKTTVLETTLPTIEVVASSFEETIESSKETTATTTEIIVTTVSETTVSTTIQTTVASTTAKTTTSTTQLEPFDINEWVEFAENYGVSIGLTLDSGLGGSWDNPIYAGPNALYTERDIVDCLDWYKSQGFTMFLVWEESRGDGSYAIYVAYG